MKPEHFKNICRTEKFMGLRANTSRFPDTAKITIFQKPKDGFVDLIFTLKTPVITLKND